MGNAKALKAGIEAKLPADRRDSVLVVIHGSPALMTAYLEAWVEGGPTLWTRKTGAKDPEGMYFAASGCRDPSAQHPSIPLSIWPRWLSLAFLCSSRHTIGLPFTHRQT